MVVKSKIGRKRYIVFRIDSDSMISKHDLIYTLNKLLLNYPKKTDRTMHKNNEKQKIFEHKTTNVTSKTINAFNQVPWVINLANNYGLIRCHHLDKDKTINLLNSIRWTGKNKNRVNISTLGTTGTIKSARKKYLDKLNLYPFNELKTK